MPEPSYNRCLILGRLTRDPESKPVGQTTLTIISVETSRSYQHQGQSKNESAVLDIEFFGKPGDEIRSRCRAGSLVHVEARLKVYNGTSQGGKAYSKMSIAGETIQIIDGGGNQRAPAPAQRPAAATRQAPAQAPQDDDLSDVPF